MAGADVPSRVERFVSFLKPIYYPTFIVYAVVTLVSLSAKYIFDESTDVPNLLPFLLDDRTVSFLADNANNLAIAGLVAYTVHTIIRAARRRKRNRRIVNILSGFVAGYGTFRESLALRIADGQEDAEKIIVEIDTYLRAICGEIQKIFSIYTNSYCHVSVKLYDVDSGQVSTFVRDTMSYVDRSVNDDHVKSYPYTDNTAFKSILENPKIDHFCSNWLRLRHAFGFYKNSHEGWKELYRATIVVPLSFRYHSADINHENVVGFLCVDNRNGNFDSRMCLDILHCFSRVFCQLCNVLGKINVERR